jgi:hypothetical protein
MVYSFELVSLKVRPAERRGEVFTIANKGIQVEDKVYMVPIHGFVQFSEAFEAMFSMPQPEGSTEGRTVRPYHPSLLHQDRVRNLTRCIVSTRTVSFDPSVRSTRHLLSDLPVVYNRCHCGRNNG